MMNKIELKDCKTPQDYIQWQHERLNEASERELELNGQIRKVFEIMLKENKKPLSDIQVANIWQSEGITMTGPEFLYVVRLIEKAHGIE